jgi:putative flippase GtrA
MNELARFLIVTVFGVVLDIGIAYALATGLGVPLWLAATIGFAIAATMNYVLHQTWSFQSGPRGLSAVRAVRYGAVALATLAARIAVIALLDAALVEEAPLLILIGGAGASFLVNFTLSKLFVFRAARMESGPA